MAENCFEIATSQSGYCVLQICSNFVVQHLLELKIPEVTENLLRPLKGSYVSLSCNKYASIVVENCLIKAEEEQDSQIILELLSSPKVSILLVDPFGNFVIQKALSVSKVSSSAKSNCIYFFSSHMCVWQYVIYMKLGRLTKTLETFCTLSVGTR
ncbi:hypothetical protein U1Q18_046854 [Sarracenia purpurea var. burkii]